MKIRNYIKFFLFSSMLSVFACEKDKEESKPAEGSIVFWTSRDNGCGGPTVTIDGKNVGQVTNWQAIPPGNCSNSNILLVVKTTQGSKNVTFKDNCRKWSTTINLNSDCFIYKLF